MNKTHPQKASENIEKNNPDQPHYGYNVTFFRKLAKLKQYELANACGWSKQYQEQLEKKPVINDQNIKTLAKALNIGEQYLKTNNIEEFTGRIVNQYGEHAIANIESYVVQTSIDGIKEALNTVQDMHTQTIEIIENNYKITLTDKDKLLQDALNEIHSLRKELRMVHEQLIKFSSKLL